MPPPPQYPVLVLTDHPLLMGEEKTKCWQSLRKLHRDRLSDKKTTPKEMYENKLCDMRTCKQTRCNKNIAIDIIDDATSRRTTRNYWG